MVRARLHLICGNCGCSKEWTWKHREANEFDAETVSIICNNCATIHSIDDNAKQDDAT
jgi:RNase P subunit RPR2